MQKKKKSSHGINLGNIWEEAAAEEEKSETQKFNNRMNHKRIN